MILKCAGFRVVPAASLASGRAHSKARCGVLLEIQMLPIGIARGAVRP